MFLRSVFRWNVPCVVQRKLNVVRIGAHLVGVGGVAVLELVFDW